MLIPMHVPKTISVVFSYFMHYPTLSVPDKCQLQVRFTCFIQGMVITCWEVRGTKRELVSKSRLTPIKGDCFSHTEGVQVGGAQIFLRLF